MKILKTIGYPLLFWVLLFAFMITSTRFDAPPDFEHRMAMSGPTQAAAATLIFCVIHYINQFLLHSFFAKKQLKSYIMGLIALIGSVSMFLYFVIFKYLIRVDIPYIVALANLIMPLLISTAYYFSVKGFQTAIELKEANAKQLEAEMQLLKMQIQPHFLFNTLNNIYATNLTQHADANEMILQLAEILRFQLESNKKQFIPLTEEIEIIENYVALEKVRLHDTKVTITKTGDFGNHTILSLLLLPLIENAFKYGKNHIDIVLKIEKNTFVFECKNEIVANITPKSSNKIGLKNVEKRLELMYADRYTFIVKTAKNNTFEVFLKIIL